MDYEKIYKDALERARMILCNNIPYGSASINDIETIFPELRESEDERIRKVIYKLMLGMRKEIFTSQDEIVTKEKALAYLEKKPDIKIWPHPIKDAYLEQKESHWKPSEEQMEALEYVIRDYREDSCNATANYLQEILDHLKNM